jgi:two-component system, sensor histidine kinase ChiS
MKTKILPILIAVIAALVAALGFWKLDQSRQQTYRTVSRLKVLQKAGPMRSRLEAGVNRRLGLAEALAAFAAANPGVTQKEFEPFARALAGSDTAFRRLVLTRHSAVKGVFPLREGGQTIGIEILNGRDQRGEAERALRTRGAVLAGPVKSAEGGTVLIVHAPVFGMFPQRSERDTTAWGLAEALISPPALFHEAGLAPFSGNLRFALRGRDGLGPKGGVFFGDERLFKANPVIMDVRFSCGSWQLAAAPAGGWLKTAPGSAKFRIFSILMVLGTGILMFPFSRNALKLI